MEAAPISPIALMLGSVFFDLAGLLLKRKGMSRDLHAAGFWTLVLGTLGSFAAVLSGLLLTNWETMGTGLLAKHHLFVWPAFGLMIGLSTWRLIVRDRASDHSFRIYLALALIAAGGMATAGYWGGELLGA